MLCDTNVKGPLGLFFILLAVCLGAAAQSPSPEVFEPFPPASTAEHSMYAGRPASMPVNSVQLDGTNIVSDPETRPWSERIAPVVIRYPGIDLASGLFQDMALARKDDFFQWVAEKWIVTNARCNNVFQRNTRLFSWERSTDIAVLQCRELNQPFKNLTPVCTAPNTATLENAVLRLRWLCTLSKNTVPVVYEESSPSLTLDMLIGVVNPASKERSLVRIEMHKNMQHQGAAPNR